MQHLHTVGGSACTLSNSTGNTAPGQGGSRKLRQVLTCSFSKWLSYGAAYAVLWISWKTFPSPILSHTAYRVRASNSDLGIPLKRRVTQCQAVVLAMYTYIWLAIWPNESPVFSHPSHPLKPHTASTKNKNQVRDNLKKFNESLTQAEIIQFWVLFPLHRPEDDLQKQWRW